MDNPQTTAIRRPLTAGPASGSERIAALDVLRGFALLGILIVNITVFQGEPPPEDHAAGVVKDVLTFAFSDKFYALFALLFGYGLAIQIRRAGTEHVARMRRRLAFLFVLGLAHAVFLFYGDVLASYAIAGVVLLALRRLSARTAARAAIWSLVGLAALHLILALGWALAGGAGDSASGDDAGASAAAMAAYQGSFTDIVGRRLSDFAGFVPLTLGLLLPNYVVLFLGGMAAGAYGLLDRADIAARSLWRVVMIGLAIGLPGAALSTAFPIAEANPLSVAARGASVLTAPALTAAYAAALLLAARTRPGRRLADLLAPAGRMALSNYIGQSLLCAMLFTGYGLGLIGTLGSLATAGVAVGIFAVQVVLSRWWLRRFRFGPLEWLLRSVTYWRRQPWRDTPAN
ncbi:DUF418 domain-containing protein [Dactylosporangium sp. CA-233914]|uniref:DUF418 domain-containing protein n=1 Tax=Dactylosporangium sp. CA-233914 TaxID=3239934 RepID=UPI003D913B2F